MALDVVTDSELLWPDRRVPFVISPNFGLTEQIMILNAMQNLSTEAGSDCIRFTGRTDADGDDPFIHFVRGVQCSSHIGRQTEADQKIELSASCLAEIGIVQHEIMHSLGFFHEMSRSDRDDYVTIIWSNVDRFSREQFGKYRDLH
ncbi:zinc metalloproteinase nas-7-like [Paramacrobiotus metropolitanus]|uniref:zinc metalloproteinase nas-7-like n=1 Tax=Paramacrobiotus metropolitanus TaxID=2943436 RepID=UPI0024465687|nr:zinc metalloproteinase nas-7-like [Paramacrobiotus metropolitanus]